MKFLNRLTLQLFVYSILTNIILLAIINGNWLFGAWSLLLGFSFCCSTLALLLLLVNFIASLWQHNWLKALLLALGIIIVVLLLLGNIVLWLVNPPAAPLRTLATAMR